jgi:nicotinamidase-related amidase
MRTVASGVSRGPASAHGQALCRLRGTGLARRREVNVPISDAGGERARRRAPAAGLQRSPTALLIVDVINPMRFDGADALGPPAVEAARCIARLKRTLGRHGVPAIYVNDNFDRWRSDFQHLVAWCDRLGGAARALARTLAPTRRDLIVLKPRHSAFDQTPLELLLTGMGASQLVITGLAADLCVQISAMDAFVRGYRIWVPEDCIAAESAERKQAALSWMRLALRCHTEPQASLAAAPTPAGVADPH